MEEINKNEESRPYNAAKYVFFYLTHLVSLIFMAISFGTIIFQAINRKISDPINLYSAFYQEGAMKFGIAALFVFAPVYYIVSHFILKAVRQGEIKRDSGIRRWLTYLILFVSFLVFAGYLVAFIISFLNGELTLKFILKVITVMIIAAAVFSFYFYDIMRKKTEGEKSRVIKIYFLSTAIAVAIVFVGSFFVIDNPTQMRAKKLDNEVTTKFYTIDNCVDQYYREKKTMPLNMDEIKANCDYFLDDVAIDKESGKAFEYRLKQDKTYELCAQFRVSNKDDKNNNQPAYTSPENKSMLHDSGWQCLERKIYYADTDPINLVK
ncbi:MAG: DUF5671 domain-containing protein [Patescibacteria group bacterium]|jgi:heme/copper-type cytochrome/quinol oxidase subunit 4